MTKPIKQEKFFSNFQNFDPFLYEIRQTTTNKHGVQAFLQLLENVTAASMENEYYYVKVAADSSTDCWNFHRSFPPITSSHVKNGRILWALSFDQTT